jgi:F-type H+-transporting ATPase subunit gamma
MFYNKPLSSSIYTPQAQLFWPADSEWLRALQEKEWSSRVLPLFTLEWDILFASLIRQYLFVSLYRACAESLTSENISRLASMQAAEGNIADRLNQLNTQFRQQRQSAITAELLDIMAGFEALTSQ